MGRLSLFTGLRRAIADPDIAIDLGTANTRMYAMGVGLVADEPSVVRKRPGSGSVEVRGAPYWRVAVVEDHRLQRKRTEELVNAQAGLRVVFGCESALELFTRLERLDKREYPHLVILDLVVDRGPSVEPEQVRDLVDRGVRVLVLSALASPTQVRAVTVSPGPSARR